MNENLIFVANKDTVNLSSVLAASHWTGQPPANTIFWHFYHLVPLPFLGASSFPAPCPLLSCFLFFSHRARPDVLQNIKLLVRALSDTDTGKFITPNFIIQHQKHKQHLQMYSYKRKLQFWGHRVTAAQVFRITWIFSLTRWQSCTIIYNNSPCRRSEDLEQQQQDYLEEWEEVAAANSLKGLQQ